MRVSKRSLVSAFVMIIATTIQAQTPKQLWDQFQASLKNARFLKVRIECYVRNSEEDNRLLDGTMTLAKDGRWRYDGSGILGMDVVYVPPSKGSMNQPVYWTRKPGGPWKAGTTATLGWAFKEPIDQLIKRRCLPGLEAFWPGYVPKGKTTYDGPSSDVKPGSIYQIVTKFGSKELRADLFLPKRGLAMTLRATPSPALQLGKALFAEGQGTGWEYVVESYYSGLEFDPSLPPETFKPR